MDNLRQRIINESRSWKGTPFKHQARLKSIGCDCIGLIVGVIKELNLEINGRKITELDRQNYSRIPQGQLLKKSLDNIFPEAKLVSEGDIFLMKFLNEPQHVGLVSCIDKNKISIIHSYQQSKGVVEHILSENWKKRLIKFYNIESAITHSKS